MGRKFKLFMAVLMIISSILPMGISTVFAVEEPGTLIESYDFEGTTEGWYGSGGVTLQSVSGEVYGANNGLNSLLSTGRTNPDYGATNVDVKALLEKGATYEISAYVKLYDTESSSLMLQMAENGSAWPLIDSLTLETDDGQWHQITGTYSFDTDMSSLELFVTAGVGESYLLDNVTITMTSPAPTATTVPTATAAPTSGTKLVALSFDDGPDNTRTGMILDKLDEYQVPATFFMIGQLINSGTSATVERVVADGHEIGNHSWAWSSMDTMSETQIQQSIADTNAAILEYAGVTPKFFRAPNLASNGTMKTAIDLTFIQGIVTEDYLSTKTAQDLSTKVFTDVTDGAIILMHDSQGYQTVDSNPTAESLDLIIPELQSQGYEFVTLTELFSRKGVTLDPDDNEIYNAVTGTTAPEPIDVNLSNDFEGNYTGWGPRGDVTLSLAEGVSHSGTSSLLTTGRADTWQGPSFNVTDYMMQGGTYDISVWVKLAEGEDPSNVKVSLEVQGDTTKDGSTGWYTVDGATQVTADNWVEFTTEYTLSTTGSNLSLYLEADTLASFYIDDFSLVSQGTVQQEIQNDLISVKDEYADYFEIGAAIRPVDIEGTASELLLKHYNSVVAENAMKGESILSSIDESGNLVYNWTEADAIANFIEANNMQFRYHTLFWHSQFPDWFFTDADGNPMASDEDEDGNYTYCGTDKEADQELLYARMEAYINAVVERYGASVDSWDVVNEVIDKTQADGMRRSRWYAVTEKEFVKKAFELTKQALATYGGTGKLYINEFDTEDTVKLNFLYDLVSEVNAEENWFNGEKLIDGVGHQTHIKINSPSISSIVESIEKFGDIGLDNQITELDISIYAVNDTSDYGSNVPEEVLLKLAYRYKELFEGLVSVSDYISNVTFWGISDNNSWLSAPQADRTDMPLLFDKYFQAKAAYWGIIDPSQLDPLIQELDSSMGTPVVDGQKELVWDTVNSNTVESGTLSADFKTLWDEGNLYVLAEVRDASIDIGDKVEVFVDENNAKTTSYEDDDASYSFSRNGGDVEGDSYSVSIEATDDGYRVEASIDLATAVTSGGLLGFDIRFTDASTSTIVSWNDTENAQDEDTSRFGELNLVGSVSVSEAVYGTPVIDGIMDDMWNDALEISTDKWATELDSAKFVDLVGSTAKVRTMWDSERIYLYAEVTDSKLSKASPDKYQQDSVEVFLDQFNNKTSTFGTDDSQYRVRYDNDHSFEKNAVEEKIESATVYGDVYGGGYVVEMSILLDAIDAKAGDVIGFDFQVNNDEDGDGTRDSVAIWNDTSGITYMDISKIGALRLVANKVELVAKIEEANALSSTDYTSSSWLELETELTVAEAVYAEPASSQIEVDLAVDNLGAAIDSLEEESSSGGDSTSSGGSSSGEATTTPVTTPTTQTVTIEAGKINIQPVVDTVSNKVTTTVDINTVNKALEQAVLDKTGNKVISVEISKIEGVKNYALNLPLVMVSEALLDAKIEVKTPVASVMVPNNMFAGRTDITEEYISLEVEATDTTDMDMELKNKIGTRPVIDVKAKAGNREIKWNNPSAPVTISVDYLPTAEELVDNEHIVVLYIDDSGKAVTVPSGRYVAAEAKVKFNTTHFSKYAVAYVKETFNDIASYSWARKQIEVLASKGIISGTNKELKTFDPARNISRADFIVLLVKALDFNGLVDSNFSDVNESKYYYEAVGIAKKLGITEGSGNNMFNPEQEITRQDMMVLVAKALRIAKKEVADADASYLQSYSDASNVSGYATESVAALVKDGIVKGSGNNLEPKGKSTRAQVAAIMYMIYNK